MKKRYFAYMTCLAASLALSGCMKDPGELNPKPNTQLTEMDQIKVPSDFNHATTRSLSFSVVLRDNNDKPLSNVRVKIFTDVPSKGRMLINGATNASGVFESQIDVPAYLQRLVVNTEYIGLPNNVYVPVTGTAFNCELGGSRPNEYQTADELPESGGRLEEMLDSKEIALKFMGTWNSMGVPNYKESVRDVIDAGLLARINASLPERRPVPVYHPDYLSNSIKRNIDMAQDGDLWVTFVHEQADWKNTLGYYTYPTGNPPKSLNDVREVTVIFPNSSYANSGGGLQSGDKVKLGHFKAGTSVGFVLIARGWETSNFRGIHRVFTTPELNPESNPELKIHTAALYDNEKNLVVIGIEDIRRDNIPVNCDHDFNDAIYYVTFSPRTAVDVDDVLPIDTPKDTDGDGTSDVYDDYPNDPTRSFDNYYPCKDVWGTLAFEDLWPTKGDYDVNDLVIGYQFNRVTNSTNKVVEVKSNFVVNAIGATFDNGFGFEMPFAPSKVKKVTGYKLTEGYINLGGNGLETDQNKAVAIAFDNAYSILKGPDRYYVNVRKNAPYIKGDTIKMVVTMNTPITMQECGAPPFNPFIIANKRRGYEVHLPDYAPTSKADFRLFGSADDTSNPSAKRFYKTSNNLPWALNFAERFDHPVEGKAIITAYFKYKEWCESGGLLFKDWYLNKPGYRNPDNIYMRP